MCTSPTINVSHPRPSRLGLVALPQPNYISAPVMRGWPCSTGGSIPAKPSCSEATPPTARIAASQTMSPFSARHCLIPSRNRSHKMRFSLRWSRQIPVVDAGFSSIKKGRNVPPATRSTGPGKTSARNSAGLARATTPPRFCSPSYSPTHGLLRATAHISSK